MATQKMNIVIVGHVDHGKSTLIGRLLYDTDSLPPDKVEALIAASEEQGREMEFAFVMDHLAEERARGVTIDTAQTFFSTDLRDYVIIDAPGHREFLKNMITGASLAEAAILVVDVKEGVRDQTRRHAYILHMLGIKQIIVVANKIDLIDYDRSRFEEVKKEIVAALKAVELEPSYVIPISAAQGDNVAVPGAQFDYEGPTVLEALDTFRNKPGMADGPFRMPVQDVYERQGKRVVAGTIVSGKVRAGDELAVMPDGSKVRVSEVIKFLAEPTEAEAGESIGLVLDGGEPLRGDVLAAPGAQPMVAKRFRANVFWMSQKPFDKSEALVFRCNTQAIECRVSEIERRLDSSTLAVTGEGADELTEADIGELVLETRDPAVVEPFTRLPEMGRFVFERKNIVVAGGIVTQVSA